MENTVIKKKKPILKILLLVFAVFSVLCVIFGYRYYRFIFQANVKVENNDEYFYIPTGSNYEFVYQQLIDNGYVIDAQSFDWVAQQKNYPAKVKAGRYKITSGMNNNELVNMLRAGNQSPVQVTFNNVRTIYQLAGKVGEKLETDSTKIIELLTDKNFTQSIGFEPHTIISMFIPNTYEFFWNTSAEKFIERMKTEYDRFWNEERLQKADNVNLSPIEVSILASVVQAEQSQHNEEKAIISGLYLNRLQRGIALQSDPTLIFAKGDFSIQRVLNEDKLIDSPYNTYMYAGLPPGPINMPEMSSLEAVLNPEKHNYIFMCAKEDFSGFHNFASSLSEHNRNAAKYQRALNERGIKR